MRVIGTAGHVDHGKSTLIQALTGTHPDRLKEEKAREMTIDLGFAWWTLPDGQEIGVVDVPGHRDFIENMLAGIGGIDAVIFVVAADEGVMPQTIEHLAILDLLQIPAGVVALTKCDMVDDPDWLKLVGEEVRSALQGTVLKDAPIIQVSAKKGTGLKELESAIATNLETQPHRPNLARPRLPIDRVFSMDGFGTVVTGTLVDGNLQVGDRIMIQPGEIEGRVRGVQSHKQTLETAQVGSRVAINISGVSVDEIARGSVVGLPNTLTPTRRVDLALQVLKDISAPLKHNSEVKFFVGAAEVLGRVRVLGVEELDAGEAGWVQLELREPIVTQRGDRYIIRRPSPSETIGGGSVLDAQPSRRHKRFAEKVLDRMMALQAGTPEEILLQAIGLVGVSQIKTLLDAANIEANDGLSLITAMLEANQLQLLSSNQPDPNSWVAFPPYWAAEQTRLITQVSDYHQQYTLKVGMPKQELKNKMKLADGIFERLLTQLTENKQMIEAGPVVHLPDHTIQFDSNQQKKIDVVMAQFSANPFSPPSVKLIIEQIGEDLYQALLAQQNLIALTPDVVFRPAEYEQAVRDVHELGQSSPITLAQMRDHWQTSRRYVQALLEYMDLKGITVRDGDSRRLRG